MPYWDKMGRQSEYAKQEQKRTKSKPQNSGKSNNGNKKAMQTYGKSERLYGGYQSNAGYRETGEYRQKRHYDCFDEYEHAEYLERSIDRMKSDITMLVNEVQQSRFEIENLRREIKELLKDKK